jgi:hypothetical protein
MTLLLFSGNIEMLRALPPFMKCRSLVLRSVKFSTNCETTNVTVFWNVVLCSVGESSRNFKGAYCYIIAIIAEVRSTSETSVTFLPYYADIIPEDSHLHTHSCDNVKSCLLTLLGAH